MGKNSQKTDTPKLDLTLSNSNVKFGDYKEVYRFRLPKPLKSLIVCAKCLIILCLFGNTAFNFSYLAMIIALIVGVLTACSEDIAVAIAYAKNGKKEQSVTFHDNSLVVRSEKARTDIKYDAVTDIIVTKSGVHLNMLDEENVPIKFDIFFKREDVEKELPFDDFVTMLESKTDKKSKLVKYSQRKGFVQSVIAAVVAACMAFLPLLAFKIPETVKLDEFTITLNTSYNTDSYDGLTVWETSAYDGLSVCIFYYLPDEFAYDYECEEPQNAEETIKTYSEIYVSGGGKYIQEPQKNADGSYACEIEYSNIDETYNEYACIIPKNGKYYFVLFQTTNTKMTDSQKAKILDYLKTVEIGESIYDSRDPDLVQ